MALVSASDWADIEREFIFLRTICTLVSVGREGGSMVGFTDIFMGSGKVIHVRNKWGFIEGVLAGGAIDLDMSIWDSFS